MGSRRRELPPAVVAEIHRLRSGGLAASAIASTLGLSAYQVGQELARHGSLRPLGRRLPTAKASGESIDGVPRINYAAAARCDLEKRDIRMLALLATGREAREVGAVWGMDRSQVYDRLNTAVYPRLGATNAANAVHICNRTNLFAPDLLEDTATWDVDLLTRDDVKARIVREYRAGQDSPTIARDLTRDGYPLDVSSVLRVLGSEKVEMRGHGPKARAATKSEPATPPDTE